MINKLLALSIVMPLLSCHPEPHSQRPNVVLILADDLGYGELGCYGNDSIETPHIDRLAAEGLRFTDFHSNGAVCSPTRAALLTGLYQQRSGIEGVVYAFGEKREVGLPLSAITIAEILQQEGYRTGLMGKWHLGYRTVFNPVRQGFDEFVGYVSGNVDYHSHLDGVGIYDWYNQEDSLFQEGYTTDLITRNAVDFIENNQDQPFFLYIAHEAPHFPFQTRADPAFRLPGEDPSQIGRGPEAKQKLKVMIETMDEGIGQVMQALRDLQLEDHTLVIFISDNGGERIANNKPLRGHKGQLWEGGHRVPAIAYYPGKIGRGTTHQTAMTMDILPTVLSLSGIEKPEVAFDGVDLSPVLLEGASLADRPLFWRFRGNRAVRDGRFKMVVSDNDTSLFDLVNDLAESIDLSDSESIQRDRMLKLLQAWEEEMNQTPQVTD